MSLPVWRVFFERLPAVEITLLILIFFAPFLFGYLRLKKEFEAKAYLLEPAVLQVDNIGFTFESPGLNEAYHWNSVRRFMESPNYIYIRFLGNRGILIPKRAFGTAKEMWSFIAEVKQRLSRVKSSRQRTGAEKLYVWGLLGLVPNIGFVAGIVLLYKGLFKYKDKKLITISLAGILVSVAFWVGFPHLVNSTVFDDVKKLSAKDELNTEVKSIEFYKQKNGNYPDKLGREVDEGNFVIEEDPFATEKMKYSKFQYQKIGNKYTLFSVGPDREAHTADDIYPDITKGDTVRFGFLGRVSPSQKEMPTFGYPRK
jgi:hypothetical protein